MSYDRLLNKTCTILKLRPRTEDWGSVDTYEESSNVKCRITPLSGREIVNGKEREESTHKVFLPFRVDITASDKIRIEGITYSINPPIKDAAGHGHHKEIEVYEFK